jgi:pimeloyl-ACP methyl ester carboxylesterase
LGLQGDVSCGDPRYRRWSNDLDALERRIEAAYAAASLERCDEIVLIGYSQGALRAEQLAARRPERYTKLVLISSPVVSSARHLSKAKAVALGFGELEGGANARVAATNLRAAGITVGSFMLPGATHGVLGPDGQRVMGDVLSWLEDPSHPDAVGTVTTDAGSPNGASR